MLKASPDSSTPPAFRNVGISSKAHVHKIQQRGPTSTAPPHVLPVFLWYTCLISEGQHLLLLPSYFQYRFLQSTNSDSKRPLPPAFSILGASSGAQAPIVRANTHSSLTTASSIIGASFHTHAHMLQQCELAPIALFLLLSALSGLLLDHKPPQRGQTPAFPSHLLAIFFDTSFSTHALRVKIFYSSFPPAFNSVIASSGAQAPTVRANPCKLLSSWFQYCWYFLR